MNHDEAVARLDAGAGQARGESLDRRRVRRHFHREAIARRCADAERFEQIPLVFDRVPRAQRPRPCDAVCVHPRTAGNLVADPFARSEEAAGKADILRAPMPGLVKIVRAAAGDAVTRGQPLLVLEAMKMEHTIAATHDGVLAEIVAEGTQVTDGMVLVRFVEAAADEPVPKSA